MIPKVKIVCQEGLQQTTLTDKLPFFSPLSNLHQTAEVGQVIDEIKQLADVVRD